MSQLGFADTENVVSPERVAKFAPSANDLIGVVKPNDEVIKPNETYYKKFIQPFLGDKYEQFTEKAERHLSFEMPESYSDSFIPQLRVVENDFQTLKEIPTLSDARLRLVTAVSEYFYSGANFQCAIEPNFLKQVCIIASNTQFKSGEHYDPDLVLDDILSAVKLCASGAIIGNPEVKQNINDSGMNAEVLTVINNWIPSTEKAAKHISDLLDQSLQSTRYASGLVTLEKTITDEDMRAPETKRDLERLYDTMKVFSLLLDNNTLQSEGIRANNRECQISLSMLLHFDKDAYILNSELKQEVDKILPWLKSVRAGYPAYKDQILADWSGVGTNLDPANIELKGNGDYYQYVVESMKGAWNSEQQELIEYHEKVIGDTDKLLEKVSEMMDMELHHLVGKSPTKERIAGTFANLSESHVVTDFDFEPDNRLLIHRGNKCEEWDFTHGEFKETFEFDKLNGLYYPIIDMSDEQYTHFIDLMKATSSTSTNSMRNN